MPEHVLAVPHGIFLSVTKPLCNEEFARLACLMDSISRTSEGA
jgi:hypothetical protein